MLKFIQGTYENGHIKLEQTPEFTTSRKVLVTFLNEKKTSRKKKSGKKRKLGSLKGKISIPRDFNKPLDELKEYM